MKSVNQVAIIGTGIIATALANLTSGHGYKTLVFARSDASEEKFWKNYKDHWMVFKNHGLMSEKQMEDVSSYVHVVRDYPSLKETDVVFESVLEDTEIKHDVYHLIESNCPRVKAICSVSSAIVPDELAEGCEKYGDRIIVTHPFNPAHIVPYFELCGGAMTKEGVIDFAKEFLESMGRKPVVLKKPTPGFIGNRLQFALWREALSLVDQGVCDPRDIDTALQYSFCPRYTSIGIFEHFDFGGMLLNKHTCDALFPLLSDATKTPESVEELIREGHTGTKAGQGFYDWTQVDMKAYAERVSEPYWKFCKWSFPNGKEQ